MLRLHWVIVGVVVASGLLLFGRPGHSDKSYAETIAERGEDAVVLSRALPLMGVTSVIHDDGHVATSIHGFQVHDQAMCKALYYSDENWVVDCTVFESSFKNRADFYEQLTDRSRGQFGRVTVLFGSHSCPQWLSYSSKHNHELEYEAWVRREFQHWSLAALYEVRSTVAYLPGSALRRIVTELLGAEATPARLRTTDLVNVDALLEKADFSRLEEAWDWLEDRLGPHLRWYEIEPWWFPYDESDFLAQKQTLEFFDIRGDSLPSTLFGFNSDEGIVIAADIDVMGERRVSFLATTSPPKILVVTLSTMEESNSLVQVAVDDCRSFSVPEGEVTPSSVCRLNLEELRFQLPSWVFSFSALMAHFPESPEVFEILSCGGEDTVWSQEPSSFTSHMSSDPSVNECVSEAWRDLGPQVDVLVDELLHFRDDLNEGRPLLP